MNYARDLSKFQVDFEHYEKLKKQDAPTVPMMKNTDKEKMMIRWAPIFEECMSRTFGHQGPLSYVLTYKGTIIPRRKISRLRVEKIHCSIEIKKRLLFDEVIRGKLGDASTLFSSGETDPDLVHYADDEVDELPTINKNKPVENDGVT